MTFLTCVPPEWGEVYGRELSGYKGSGRTEKGWKGTWKGPQSDAD
jgi:hypothetical protein